jgi:hypothetical protein
MQIIHPEAKARIDKWLGEVCSLPLLRFVEIIGRAFIAGGLIFLLTYAVSEIHQAADYYGFYDAAGAVVIIGIGLGILIIRWIPDG